MPSKWQARVLRLALILVGFCVLAVNKHDAFTFKDWSGTFSVAAPASESVNTTEGIPGPKYVYLLSLSRGPLPTKYGDYHLINGTETELIVLTFR